MRVLVYLSPCRDAGTVAQSLAELACPGVEIVAEARNANAWGGEVERYSGLRRVDAVLAPGHERIAAVYAASGIPTLRFGPAPVAASRVVIACPGPSLSAWLGRMPVGVCVIAINRAACAVACDYWMALDADAFEMFSPQPPALACVSRSPHLRHPTIVLDRREMPGAIGRLTLPAAVWFASQKLKAMAIEIVGADLAGAADWTGETAGGRTAARWRMEEQALAEASALAASSGASVRRLSHPEARETTEERMPQPATKPKGRDHARTRPTVTD